jgi:uncharacterized phage protein (TIGR02220 family)
MEVMKLIVKDSDLSKNEIRVLLAILSFSRKQKKQIKRSYLSDLLNIHSQNISRTTKNLERKGYLSRDYTDGVCSYEIVMEMIRSQNHHSDGNETSQNHHFDGNDTPRHYIKDITVLDIDIQKGGSGGETDPIPYGEIITDLNQTTEKTFLSSAKKTRELIKARWNEGFRLENFIHVHKVKTEEWGTNLEMNKFLRPETLYSNKFHSYVNEKLKEEIQKSAEEEKMNSPETKEDIEYVQMITGNMKQLN